MQLIYIDESGNTGENLDDPQQPVFTLCAMLVPEHKWAALDSDLRTGCTGFGFQADMTKGSEVHAADLMGGRGRFKTFSLAQRLAFRDNWLRIAAKHDVKEFHRSIRKSQFRAWLDLRSAPRIHPQVAAFALLSQAVDAHLGMSGSRGMFIFDESDEVSARIERSIAVRRGKAAGVMLTSIIEKGFFIESHKSLSLQLCDLIAYQIRKAEECRLLGTEPKPRDADGIKAAEGRVVKQAEKFRDVTDWLIEEHSAKK